jgi:hypothetical protein
MVTSATSSPNWFEDRANRTVSRETLQEGSMQLVHDKELEEDLSPFYGKYLGTFFSARRQIRADLFDDGVRVTAYLSYPTGLNPTNIDDRYVSELREHAASEGFADRFSFVYADY